MARTFHDITEAVSMPKTNYRHLESEVTITIQSSFPKRVRKGQTKNFRFNLYFQNWFGLSHTVS